jgi:hypothetical protein
MRYNVQSKSPFALKGIFELLHINIYISSLIF